MELTFEMVLVMAVAVGAMALFLSERFSVDVVSMSVLGTLMVLGLVKPAEAISGFSNRAVITIAALFIISQALVRTGIARILGGWLAELCQGSYLRLLLALLPTVAIMSAFINNTAVVTVFIPVVMQLAHRYDISPSRLLMPLSFAPIFGGTLSLIGTSTNILVNSLLLESGGQGFAMFEIAPLGAIFIVVGLSYLYLLSPRLVPERRVQEDVSATYSLKDYLTEFLVPQDSPLVGETISESGLDTEYEVQVLGVHRSGSYIWEGLQAVTIQAEDHLIARVSIDEVLSLTDRGWLSASVRDINPAEEIRKDDVGIAEAIIGADSNLTGQLLGDINFRNRYGVFVLAARSRERTLQKNLEDVELNYGDTLLIQGPRERLAELGNSPDFLLIEEREVQPVRWEKSPWTLAIMAAVIVLAVTRVLPIMVSAFLGALAVVAFGTLTNQEAYQAIRWPVIFLLAGILPLGIAFENTGAAGWIAQTAIMPLEQWGPHALIGGMYLITSLLTELMSNNSTAVLLTPIALNVAQLLEVSSRPLLVTVMFAASASFMTPIGYKTNTMVYGTGGYRFTDFMRLGVPLNLLFALIAAIAIPLIWPF